MAAVEPWQEVSSKKRAEVASKIPKDWILQENIRKTINASSDLNVKGIPASCGLLNSKDLEITEQYDATALTVKMATRSLTATEVTMAFCKRAAIAHQLTNCLTEIFFEQAMERARYLDEYIAREGRPVGPLHGMPISLKDSFNVKNVHTTIGYIDFVKHPPSEVNSALVDILLQNGAVLYVKTNIPQALMTTDSENNVFGRVLNPYRLSIQAGGSSGGEGALIAMRGSLLGVGTDIGGSIRIPAFCCGLYGFKPSPARIPFGGQTNPIRPGWSGVIPSAGPLAHTTRDIHLFMETVIKSSPWDLDHTSLAIPWRTVHIKQPLTIGVLFECPSSPLQPPILRAMKTAAKMLGEAGHKIVLLNEFPSFKEAAALTFQFYDVDNTGAGKIPIINAGEPLVRSVAEMYPEPPGGRKDKKLEEFFELNARQEVLRRKWLNVFTQNKLDVLLAPGSHKTGQPHDTFGVPPYTMMWNLLAYPACVIPFLNADKSLDLPDNRIPEYQPEVVDGLPCTVQVIARGEHDEELLCAVEIISKVLKV